MKHKIFNFAVFCAATVATTPFWPVAAHADSNEKVVTEPQSDSLVSVSNEGNCDKLSVRVEIDWNRDENAQSFVSRYAHGTESKVAAHACKQHLVPHRYGGGSIATVLAFAGAIYGLWVAFFYDGGMAGLVPFAIAACVGAVCAGIRAASAVSPGHGLWPALCGPDTRRDMLSKSSPFASPTLNG